MHIYHSHCLTYSPPFVMVLRAYAELVEKGWSPPELPFNNTTPVVWVQDEQGRVIGTLVYYTDKPRRLGYQLFIYVNPEHRNKGIGQALVDEVCERIRNEGGDRLIRSIHVDNKAPLSVIGESKATMMRYELDLTKKAE